MITRLRAHIIDTDTAQRWSDDEILRYLSDAQRSIVAIDPSANATISSVQTAEGTRQSLPAGGLQLITVIRNMGTDGTTPGRAVRVVRREIMDGQFPDWHRDTKTNESKNFVYDPSDETAYYVWPPSRGSHYLQINYAKIPDQLTATTDELELDSLYETPIFDYCMYRMHSKDADFSAGLGTARAYAEAFNLFMRGHEMGSMEESPNATLGPFNPKEKGMDK